MKRVMASEGRKNWFRILDDVASGEVVVIYRKGKKLVLRREKTDQKQAVIPSYKRLIRVPRPEEADQWRWQWSGPGEDLLSSTEEEK